MKPRRNQTFWLFFVFYSSSTSLINLFFAAARDTISSGQSLTFNQTLISKDGKFELGFFTPGTTSLNHYIGIWYKNVPNKIVVWVANRDTPLTHDPTSSAFKLLENGNLVLLNQYSKLPIWSTESSSNNGNVLSEAMLGDDGNLVLRRIGPPADVIWQSFDYPTDTILPGAKIGYNRTTKILQSLTSWRSPNDPAKGLYSAQIDPDKDEFFIKSNPNGNRSWSSGAWNGQLFRLVPEMKLVYDLNYRYVKNVNESYFTYYISNSSIPFRLVMNLSGQLQHLKWPQNSQSWHLFWSQPIQHSCEAYTGYCGPFSVCDENYQPLCRCLNGFMPQSPKDWNFSNFYDGCVRINNLQCDDEVEFLRDYQQLGFFNQQLNDAIKTAHGCKKFCLEDCSCHAYAFNSSCLLWKNDKFTLQQLQKDEAGQPPLYIQLRVAASKTPGPTSEIPSTTSGGKKPLKPYIIVLIAGSIFVSIFSCFSFAYIMKRRGKLKFKTTETSLAELHEPEQGKLELPLFDFNAIATATNNFSNKLGQGGFGPVYKILSTNYGLEEVYMHTLFKFFNYFSARLQNLRNFVSNLWRIEGSSALIYVDGKLLDGREIAVKRLSSCSGQGEEEFKNELMLISKLQHRNLVRLLGYCICKEEKILLYEYMQNKSLDAILFDATKRILLDWSKRFNIIDGIARGLLYLHRDSRLKVIHRDLKASNVLLDEDMNPKISDFGLARIFGEKQTLGNTNRVVGTYGYMSPEYALEGMFSEKSDVFSFGVLLLEIVSSKKSSNLYTLEESSYNLIGYVWRMWNENKVVEIIDPTLAESYNLQELMRCIHIGLLCVQDHALDRPTMSAVISMLNSEGTLPLPKEAAFLIDRMQFSNILLNTRSDVASINRVTITNLEAR